MKLSFKRLQTDSLLVLSVFIVASCGLAYELIAGALASYVLGDSVLQFSTIIGTYLFAMGIGSHLSKYVPEEKVLQRFIEIEILVGLVGGLSAIALFLAFAWLPTFKAILYAMVMCIGILVGMEIPLVMRIFNSQKQAFHELVSRVLTFDYLGALAVSLLFPLVLAPMLGLARSAVLFGILNVMVAGWTAWHFYPKVAVLSSKGLNDEKLTAQQLKAERIRHHKVRNRLIVRILMAMILLLVGMLYADRLVGLSEQKLFKAPVIFATNSPYQRLIVTEKNGYIQLFLNGNLQFSTRDEYRYHEALVHPIMQKLSDSTRATKPKLKVLILGGGDGMAAREVLKYDSVEHITLVDLDPKMTDFFANTPRFQKLNSNSMNDPRVSVINADAYKWLESNQGLFDAIIIDLPDPSHYSLAKLYSEPMYHQVRDHLTAEGLVVVQSTSPYYAPRSFWSIDKTLQLAGFKTTPYHAYVPSFGEWGFIVGSPNTTFEPPTHYDLPMAFLTPSVSREMFTFPPDMQPIEVEPNTLDKQILVHYYLKDWSDE
ncbi:polyamine aminopropyltransferase [Psychrobacter sanguinis]|uniref:polyamine aminopropyltransferase n=1 Tax=Psychrobacter sanguinis TaxID=861445 RepID=UPI00020C9793|nr:polyamine aminopropyltransferase [Psychrobacter sanguinis]EGK15290.1 spermidine synthase [Psychrobacter sp. 1501(2011)]MCD9151375.1 polyamine aminopropyltransferase [Psychrobacter sanguinis]